MKKMIAAALLAASSAAMAAGQFDGVYQSTVNPEQFYAIHQNGNTLLLTAYGTMRTDGTIGINYGATQFRPPKLYTWDVQMGELQGNRAIMTGGSLQNGCTVTYQLELSAGAITATLIGSEPRLANLPCASLLLPAGTVITAHRIF